MKQPTLIICALLALCAMPLQRISADTVDIPLQQNSNPDENDVPGLGHRMPSRPIQCVIDTDTKEVTLIPYVDDILSYEIWDEAQTIMLFSTDEPAEFVDHLLTSPSPVTIVITTNNKSYVGLF